MSEEGTTKETSMLAIILFVFLSMIFAEVFSGADPLWFLNAWGWFVSLPLYGAHALLLLNLAMRYERTSLTQLYLWGVLFGLYEGWITKVIWAGYMDSIPTFGTFFGFAIGEFLIIVLFWHAVFSFIIPILVFQIVVQGTNKGDANAIYTSHLKVISKNTRNKILLGIVILAGSFFITMGLNADSLAIIVAGGVNFAYIYMLSWIATTWSKKPLSLESLRLGERGMVIVVVYLIALYGIMFLTLLPERIPSVGTILLTIAFYMIVITMIFLTPRDTRKTIELPSGIMNFGDLTWALIMLIMLAITWSMLSIVALFVGTLFYAGMLLLGPILFFVAVINVLRKYRASTQQPSE